MRLATAAKVTYFATAVSYNHTFNKIDRMEPLRNPYSHSTTLTCKSYWYAILESLVFYYFSNPNSAATLLRSCNMGHQYLDEPQQQG